MYEVVVQSWENTLNTIWNVEKLREIQINTLNRIVYPDICWSKLLFIVYTRSGGIHFLHMLRLLLGGVIIIINFYPFISLSGDQMTKTAEAYQNYDNIEIQNIKKLSHGWTKIDDDIIPYIDEIMEGTNSRVYIFVSPQELAIQPSLTTALLKAQKWKVLQAIGINEVHLYMGHSHLSSHIKVLNTFPAIMVLGLTSKKSK